MKVLTASLILALTLAGFQNCSEVAFNTSSSEIAAQQVEFLKTSELEIEGGAEFTRNSLVQLKLTAVRALEMKISNTDTCSDGNWEPFTTAKVWTLSKSNATAAVYAQFKDIRGTISECVKDDIVHDNIAPTAAFSNLQGFVTNIAGNNVQWNAMDNLSGVASTTCRASGATAVACPNFFHHSATADGNISVAIKLKDKAGNESPEFTYSWIFDHTPPVVTINSRPGAISGSASATLAYSANDALSGIDKFQCRVDGAAFADCPSPMNFSSLSEGAHNFEVYAFDKAGNKSATAAAAWSIDLTAPSLSFTSTPAAINNSHAANFTYTGIDDGQPVTRFECRLDAGNFATCNGTSALANVPDGAHAFYIRGYDTAGNVSSPIQYNWVIDTAPPSVSITAFPAALNNQTTASFAWLASDAGSGIKVLECRLDGAAYVACGATGQSFANLGSGAHSLDVRATDFAGNVGNASKNWTIDLVAPVVAISSGPAPYVKVTTAQIVFAATDAGGIGGYECRVDNDPYAACASPKDLSLLAEGGHNFFVRAIDKAGNVSNPVSHSWTIDMSPPLIRVISQPVAIKQGDPAMIEYQVIDPSSGVASVICGLANNVAACAESAKIDLGTALATGSYSFQIKATDKVGNSLTETVSFQVTARVVICDPFVAGGEAACNGGLIGDIYYLDSAHQTAFKAMGNKTVDYFYTNGILVNALLNLKQLAVSTRSFTAGFPSSATGALIQDNAGQTLNEYFAFRLETVLKLDATVDQAGWYQFATISDDGSMIMTKPAGSTQYTQAIVSNDGDHSTGMACSTSAIYVADATRLPLLVKYYQGPRTEIALSLLWKRVPAINTALDAACGTNGATAIANGWRIVAPGNLIAPAR